MQIEGQKKTGWLNKIGCEIKLVLEISAAKSVTFDRNNHNKPLQDPGGTAISDNLLAPFLWVSTMSWNFDKTYTQHFLHQQFILCTCRLNLKEPQYYISQSHYSFETEPSQMSTV